MNRCPPRLLNLATSHLIDEVRGGLRHAIRNKLGGARNAAFYLRKKVLATELPAQDARVTPFFEIIFDAVESCVALLESQPPPQAEPPPSVDVGDALAALARGLALPPGVSLEVAVDGEAARLAIDPDELQVAVFFALGEPLDLAVARGGGALRLGARGDGAHVLIDVVDVDAAAGVMDADPEPPATTARDLPRFSDVARRVLARWGGELDLPGVGDGVRATLRVPLAAVAP
jgi:hypothetical protein